MRDLFRRKSRERRLVFHIGPHKTATTYIQENLAALRKQLASAGWIYPTDPHDERSGHHGLGLQRQSYLEPDGPHHHVLLDWKQQSEDDGKHLLLSTEAFCNWRHEELDEAAKVLGFASYEVIYAIRDPLDVIPSHWAEEVKHGITPGFPERFARYFAEPAQSRFLNPMRDLTPLKEKEWVHLHAIPYDLLQRKSWDIFTHMVHDILGVTKVEPIQNKIINQKYSVEVTEFLRLMTLIKYDGELKNGPELRLRATGLLSDGKRMKEITRLMREEGKPARRNLPVRGYPGIVEQIEDTLRKQLRNDWSCDVPENEPLFVRKKREFAYYDAFRLSRLPAVMNAAEAVLKELFP